MNANIAVIGMGVMGSCLALNMANHNFKVSVYNYTPDLTDKFIKNHPHKNITAYYDVPSLVQSVARPRKFFIMVTAGKAVDSVIDGLLPHLDPDDIIMDGGNSFYKDTQRRYDYVTSKGFKYFGIGVSGGEEGALNGPALMPGGNAESYKEIQPVMEAIAAKADDGKPCCTYIGEDGAGHYVKMVHNGIEYADMQLIAEAYLLLKNVGKLSNEQISQIFHEWNQGELSSFLISITANILKEADDMAEGYLVDKILDSAGQKGTGRWTSIAALEQGVNTSIMTSACNARNISSFYAKRQHFADSDLKQTLPVEIDENFVEDVRRSLYTAKIAAYTQGFELYKSASEIHNWHLNLGSVASIFRAGCIIKAKFLNNITNAYQKNPNLENLLEDDFFFHKVQENQQSLRKTIAKAVSFGVPIPAFSNAMAYIDGLCTKTVGANLIQAQRDYFGAHTYKRIDREGTFHHQWQKHY
ncbi:NADP-dependent phosphogluconate dehydrogenase [Megamonas hypermegale]|uniref:NADP-dependent phosphogluconate dehydrogenase n=1 Tax=Megamonas hypermegale TaxID=158847 RepID=UPI00195BDC53|nr:NADP-dependent phosphogluconate dehydrogenase [Megamonas hypermegale]MBM6832566.1 NADP-dependent phosphogluconate dehydrogenase [Megamonas hypermegale]